MLFGAKSAHKAHSPSPPRDAIAASAYRAADARLAKGEDAEFAGANEQSEPEHNEADAVRDAVAVIGR